MNILDEFLNDHDINRYRLAKITGISNQLLLQYTKKGLTDYPVWLLRALASATDLTIEEVLNKLEILETAKHQLYGIRAFLEKHNCSFPQEELKLYRALYSVESLNMDLEEMKFDRFEKEEHVNIENDVQKAVNNAAETIEGIKRRKINDYFDQ
ncbi:helix-turn-helix domain-containing protein [Listeria monocytogenes]